jgi:tetratricopeptide (TPR) repeat protein
VIAVRILCVTSVGLCLALGLAVGAGELRADDGATARHLLLGVRAFKAERYAEALVELRLVARAPDAPADLAFYLGPTLYKLQRYDEALAVFAGSRADRDALTDFYLGQTCYQLRLFRKARAVFAELRARGLGPALHDAAGRYVATVDAAYQTPPTVASIDYYLAEGLERAATDPIVAAEYLDEARQVEALAAQPHRHLEIVAGLAAAWNDAGRAQSVIALVAAERTSPPELTWQLARAYAATADAAHARPLLQAIIKAHGPRATEATALLAHLGP